MLRACSRRGVCEERVSKRKERRKRRELLPFDRMQQTTTEKVYKRSKNSPEQPFHPSRLLYFQEERREASFESNWR